MNRLKFEFRNLNVFLATLTAGIFIFIDFSVWCAIGSPVYVLRFISGYLSTLPLWLFGLCDFISCTLLGFSLGALLASSCSVYDVDKYRGSFYFIIGAALMFLHHVFFFSGARFFISMLVSILECTFFGIALINFAKASKLAFFISLLGVLWRVYLLIFNITTFFLI